MHTILATLTISLLSLIGVLRLGLNEKTVIKYFLFAAALPVVIGGIFSSFFMGVVENLSGWMVAFSVNAFIFLSASELIPEMHKERNRKKVLIQLCVLLLGMITIYALGLVFHHEWIRIP